MENSSGLVRADGVSQALFARLPSVGRVSGMLVMRRHASILRRTTNASGRGDHGSCSLVGAGLQVLFGAGLRDAKQTLAWLAWHERQLCSPKTTAVSAHVNSDFSQGSIRVSCFCYSRSPSAQLRV